MSVAGVSEPTTAVGIDQAKGALTALGFGLAMNT